MNPYVIDRSKLNFYIVFAVILIISSFFSGYYFAQYRAGNVFSATEPETEINSVSEQVKKIELDELKTSSTGPGSEAKINQESAAIKAKQTDVSSTKPVKSVTKNTRPKPPSISQSKPRLKKPVTQTMADATSPDSSLASASVSSNKLRYSVQAGMFGNQVNANKFLYQLQTAGFDGYMDEHQGDDGVMRYNVRFGRFASRAEAEQRLGIYRQGFSTPAYVIINQ